MSTQQINKDINDQISTTNQNDQIYIYRTLSSTTEEYIFSQVQVENSARIGGKLGNKTQLKELKRVKTCG